MEQFTVALFGSAEVLFDIIEKNDGRTKLSDDKRVFCPTEPLNGDWPRLHKIAAEMSSNVRVYAHELPFDFSEGFLFGGWLPFHRPTLTSPRLKQKRDSRFRGNDGLRE